MMQPLCDDCDRIAKFMSPTTGEVYCSDHAWDAMTAGKIRIWSEVLETFV